MRLPRVVAGLTLIVGLALVVVPATAGSWDPSPDSPLDSSRFQAVTVSFAQGTTTTTPTFDPGHRSDGALETTATLLEPADVPEPAGRALGGAPPPPTGVIIVPVWKYDGEVSWYGPGFYGKRTACGYAFTQSIIGVAHRDLPCGTKVTFRNPANGRTITMPVIDRGPYVAGRQWDLSGGACLALGHCYTGPIYWKFP